MPNKKLLVDGNSVAYPIYMAKQQNESLIIPFIKVILNICLKYKINILDTIVFWDGPSSREYRQGIYPEYKGNRCEKDKEWFQQSNELKAVLNLFLRQIESVENEADDEIFTYCSIYYWKKELYILSRDKDLLQCCHMNSVNQIRGEKIVNKNNFHEITGVVDPERFLYYLALTGDSADNVPGVKGIGDVKAKKIVNRYWNELNYLIHDDSDESTYSSMPSTVYKDFCKIRNDLHNFKMSVELIQLNLTTERKNTFTIHAHEKLLSLLRNSNEIELVTEMEEQLAEDLF